MSYNEVRVREIFFEEMAEILDAIDENIILLEQHPSNMEFVRNIFRHVHTLKGSSGVMGFRAISGAAHRMEDHLEKIRSGKLSSDQAALEIIKHGIEQVREMIEAARRDGVDSPDSGERFFRIALGDCENLFVAGIDPRILLLNCRDLASRDFCVKTILPSFVDFRGFDPERCLASFDVSFWSTRNESEIRDVFEFVEGSALFSLEVGSLSAGDGKSAVVGAVQSPVYRDPADKLDRMFALSNEFSKLKTLFEGFVPLVERGTLERESILRIREAVSGFSRLSAELRECVVSACKVSVGSLVSRYSRVVRDVSRRLGKRVNLVVEGESLEIDKAVAEVVSDPIMHLLRNAVDHGIESCDSRRALGKPEVGTIVLSVVCDAHRVRFVVRDDGRGLDVERIRKRALAQSLVSAQELETMTRSELFELIFLSGFSTAETITDVSGRGVGMDVVRSNVIKAGGTIVIDSTPGGGTAFTLTIPSSLALLPEGCDPPL
jgi:two-component system chemotaxis sensor kinase CheA